ncbi:hypothetical protein N9045_01105 [bacterium]|nr:hypothetical protein [bacterium]
MIVAERYGGGHRWHCTDCDKPDKRFYHSRPMIMWWNSYPPPCCRRCSGKSDSNKREAALAAVTYLKNKYEERAYFPGSIRAIADLCEKHNLVPNGMPKTHFAKLINQVAE